MRHHVLQRDTVLLHEDGRELRRALQHLLAVAATVLAHLDTDGVAVPRTIEVRMLTLFIRRHVLDRHMIIHREVPDQETDAVAMLRFGRTQRTVF